MGDLSKNLSREEFKCPCGCEHTPVDIELVQSLQDAVDHYTHMERGKSLMFQRISCVITSGYRCPEHNKSVKGASDTSLHQWGMAADHRLIAVYGDGTRTLIDPVRLAEYYRHRYPDSHGVGTYSNRVHVDVRAKPARW